MNFETKDSGKRDEFPSGMKRDTQDDKPRYDLIDSAFLKRWAELMARGAKKYGENNWKKASTQEELTRFRASAIRHMFQYLEGDRTEDHCVAVAFNLAGAEMVSEKLKNIGVREMTAEERQYYSSLQALGGDMIQKQRPYEDLPF